MNELLPIFGCGVVIFFLAVPLLTYLILERHREKQEKQNERMLRMLGQLMVGMRELQRTTKSPPPIEPLHAHAPQTPAIPLAPQPVTADAPLFEPVTKFETVADVEIVETPSLEGPPPTTLEKLTAAFSSEDATKEPVAAEVPEKLPRAPAPAAPNRFEEAGRDVLQRIWNWIVVGEESIPEGVSFEFAVASQWLLRIGILILVVGIGFFLKYSIEKGYITPVARVLLSAGAGVAMVAIGTRLLGRRYHVFGQGLQGGGIATLYFSVYAAANFHHLLDQTAAFGLMSAITVLAGTIAVGYRSQLVAVLGTLGGYGTPVMLSTGVVDFPVLYGYLLLLGIGVLGVSVWRQWPLLQYLSFLSTWGLFSVAQEDYTADHFPQVMPFLYAFFGLFSTMVFLHNVLWGKKSNVLDLLVLVLNALIVVGFSYKLIEPIHGRQFVAVATIFLAAFYAVHAYVFLVRRLADRELFLCFAGLTAFFLTISVPLWFTRDWLSVSWSVLAVVLLWIGLRLQSHFVQQIAFALYGLVLCRYFLFDLPRTYAVPAEAGISVTDYLRQLWERAMLFGTPIVSLAGGWRLLRRPPGEGRVRVSPDNDVPGWIPPSAAAALLGVLSALVLFVFVHLELNRTLGFFYAPIRLPMLTVLWAILCISLVELVGRRRPETGSVLATLVAVVIMIKLFAVDAPAWNLGVDLLYGGDYRVTDGLMRLLDFGVAVFCFIWAARAFLPVAEHDEVRQFGWFFVGSALMLPFIAITLEVRTVLHAFFPGLESGGVSIWWGLYALGLVLSGIRRRIRVFRYCGLALFTIAALKVFFIDLAELQQIYRIIAFIVLGLVVLSGSFVYLKYREIFETEEQA